MAAAQRMKPQFAALGEDDIHAMNVAGVENVLAAALETGVRKVVHISSSGVYGIPRSVPVGEDHPQRPLGAYGRSKIAGEQACRRASCISSGSRRSSPNTTSSPTRRSSST